MEFVAGCHCGALSARYQTMLPTASWSMRACQCAFCIAHGAVSTSDPNGSMSFSVSEPDLLQRYQFGTRSADFLICKSCGVFVGVVMTHGTQRWGVLNVRTVQPQPSDLPASQPLRYGAEGMRERAQRRTARWTPLSADSL
jgi:hypothetical protein